MTGTGRQRKHIASPDLELAAALATQHQPGMATSEAEHFVRGGMVVVKGVYAVAPLCRPAVRPEQGFARARGISGSLQHAAVQQHGKY